MTVSEFIFDFIQKKETEKVFMVSGSSAMWLTDALCRNERLEAICNNHEQASVMCADLYARTTDKWGAALVTVGPGAMNAITGVAQAYTDSSALIVISGQASSKLIKYEMETGIRQHGTQSVDLSGIVSPITKYFAVVLNPEDIRYHMEKAYYEAMSGRKGPVWIDVPVDIQNKQVPDEMKGFEPCYKLESYVMDYNIQKIFLDAQKPLIIAGGGADRQSIEKLSHSLNIPVVTSRMGIDSISSEDEYYVGRPGSNGQRAAHFAIQQCDLLIVLGCRLSVSTIGYYPDRLAPNARKIQIDIDEKELAKQDVPIDCKINCSVDMFVNEALKLPRIECDKWVGYCNMLKKTYPVYNDRYELCNPLNSYYFTKLLSDNAPENAVVVVDTGSVCNVASQIWEIKNKQKYLISGGLSCMGFWAGALGCESNSIIALAGDGSVSMNIQEFATLSYNDIPVKLFVYNNYGYMLIRHNQHNYMNDRFLGVGPDSGVKGLDFCKIARAYDLNYIRITKDDDVCEKIREVLAARGPIVCEVILEQFGPMEPRISSRVMPDGTLKAAEYDDLAPFLEEKYKPEIYEVWAEM